MTPTWRDKHWRDWQYPRPVPYNMIRLWRLCEAIRKQRPDIWAMGGNVVTNRAYAALTKIIREGRFTGEEKITLSDGRRSFVPVWQASMARYARARRLPGIMTCLKWLSVPDIGWAATNAELQKALDTPAGRLPKSKNLTKKKQPKHTHPQ